MNSGTRLTGRFLRLAQWVWVVVALFYGVLLMTALLAASQRAVSAPPDFQDLLNTAFKGWTEAQLYQAFAEHGLTPHVYSAFTAWSNLLLGPAYFALGLLLFWRRPDDWLALLFSITLLTFIANENAVNAFGASGLAAKFDLLTACIGSVVGPVAFMVFPDGRFVTRWMRGVPLLLAGIQLWRFVFPEAYAALGLVLALPTFAAIAFSLLYRYGRVADLIQRQQIKWMVFAVVVTVVPLLVYVGALALLPAASQPSGFGVALFIVGSAFWTSFLILWPTGLIIAILRYRLWDIDLIIRRTLVYSALTAVLALAYFGSVLVLGSVFRALTGQEQNSLVVVLSTLAIAALFVPLRARVQAAIDRRFFRQKYDAARTLAGFAASARDETDLARLSAQLVGAVDETMQPAHVRLWLKAGAEQGRSKT